MIPETRKQAFEVLGLPESASKREITLAYLKLVSKWHPDKQSDESQEEKTKEIVVAYGILTGKIKIEQQHNYDWADQFYKMWKECYGSHLSKEEVDLFPALSDRDLTKVKTLLERVPNINAQTKLVDKFAGDSILHRIVKNACNDPNWTGFRRSFIKI